MFKNVILITIDSLRADHLSPYNYPIETPNIDKLASQGILFKNAYANSPGTPSSFQAILTSTYPTMYGGYGYMSKFRPYLPNILKSALGDSIYTIGIVSNPYLSHYYGYNRGFDFFYDGLNESSDNLIQKGVRFLKHLLQPSPYPVGSTLNKIAKKQIHHAKNTNRRIFMWIHYMDVHFPYFYKDKLKNLLLRKKIHLANSYILKVVYGEMNSIPKDILDQLIILYDEGILRVDKYIGDLISFLEKEKLLEDTLVILTADHGDEFMEHGGLGHTPKLYNELLHIPLILSNPSLTNRQITKRVDQLDISPTICEVLGCAKNKKWLGQSLLGISEDKLVISEVANTSISDKVDLNEWRISIIDDKWKAHYYARTREIELYDLEKDPQEKINVAKRFKKTSLSFREVFQEHMTMVRGTWSHISLKKAIKNLKLKGKI
ncbi:sulfatase [Thermococcus sp. 21S7]|uniref:sulfatase n=1 Tax=Thermococcus sp. 21S7 TaxID=1638221 RepID=UPI00143A9FFE|nr:sulfatase [Thermococcus sp. 21S7]NJE61786.1 hypothetical protein [Thermococcus sp. 21S7]